MCIRDRDETVRFVRWNTDAKTFQLLTLDELDHFELLASLGERSASYPTNGQPRVIIDKSSCGKNDWLLVSEAVQAVSDTPYLREMDIIMAVKRLDVYKRQLLPVGRTRSAYPTSKARP